MILVSNNSTSKSTPDRCTMAYQETLDFKLEVFMTVTNSCTNDDTKFKIIKDIKLCDVFNIE